MRERGEREVQRSERRRGRRLLFWICGFAVMGVVVGGVARWSWEPRYGGRRASDWVREIMLGDARAGAAGLRGMGEAAVPTLVRLVQMEDSALKARYLGWVDSLPPERARLLPWNIAAKHWQSAALRGLQVLGTNAQAAVPALLQLIADPSSPWRGEAIELIAEAGAHDAAVVVPVLIGVVEEATRSPGDRELRDLAGRAALALGTYGAAGSSAVPALLAWVRSPIPVLPAGEAIDPTVRALQAFGRIGRGSPEVIECVQAQMAGRRRGVFLPAAEAYWRLTGDGEALVAASVHAAERGEDVHLSPEVIASLGAAVDPLIPRVVDMIRELPAADPFLPSDMVSQLVIGGVSVTDLLGGAPAESRRVVLRLEDRLDPRMGFPWELLVAFGPRAHPLRGEWVSSLFWLEPMARVEMVHALWHLGSDASELVPHLASVLEAVPEENDFVTWYALEVLGEIGVEGRSAAPAVRGLLTLDDAEHFYDLRRTASNTLRCLEGRGSPRCYAPSREKFQ